MSAAVPQTPSRWELTRWLVGHTRALLPALGLSAVSRVVNQILAVALLVTVAYALGRAAAGQPVDGWALAGGLVLVALVKAALRYLEHYAGHWVAFTALARLREFFFARLIPQAPAATQGRAGAELTERATRDIDRVEVFFAHTFAPAVSALLVPTIGLGWLASAVDPRLALAILPFVAAVMVVPLLWGRGTWHSARRVAARRGEIAARVGDDIQGVREVLGFGIADRRLAGLAEADRRLGAARSEVGRNLGFRAASLLLLEAAGLIVLLAVGLAQQLPAGQIAVGLAVAVGLWAPARGIDDFVAGLDAAFAAAARVREVTDGVPLVTEPAEPVDAPRGDPVAVALDHVSLRYPVGQALALDQVSVGFLAGAHSCVAGVSGSGKSTLAGLLLRGWDPTAGIVRLHGTDLRDLRLTHVRERIGLVPQHPTLLSGTVLENLRLAAPEATEGQVREALAVAGLDEWLASLPDGLDTPVSERGLNVSGGQLQRIALARTLVAAPEILVLDEALSQLDSATAAAVRRKLAVHRAGLTTIEITHRADLIPGDTFVVVLDAGRVIEQGTAADLRATGGAFTHLEARAG
jgi:ABC-type multidrug transport system fused ATPase/permease subunit